MSFDLAKLDLMKVDITKIDLHDIKTIQLFTAAFTIAVIILDLFLFMPLYQSIEQAKVQRSKDVAAVDFFKDLISKKDKLTSAQIIPQERIDALLDEVQRLADKDGIRVEIGASLIDDKKVKPEEIYSRKVFSIKAFGPFKELGVFFTSLRGMPDAVLDIQDIELSSDKEDVSKLQAQVSLTVLTTKNDEDQ